MRLPPNIRGTFIKLVKKGLAVTSIAELFETTRQTVQRWLNRAKHVGREYFKDKPRKPKPAKITAEVELSVLKLRKSWRSPHGVEAHFADPSYPQDKDKVERCIQNLNREFVNHLRRFPEWLKGRVSEYRDWFNHSRFHRGVRAFPATLYEYKVRNLT